MAWIGKFEITLLVGSGSTLNFINFNIVNKVGLKSSLIVPFEVNITNGGKLRHGDHVWEVKMNLQRVMIVAEGHVLSLVGLDVVLGNAWPKGPSRAFHDCHNMTIEFKLGLKKRV